MDLALPKSNKFLVSPLEILPMFLVTFAIFFEVMRALSGSLLLPVQSLSCGLFPSFPSLNRGLLEAFKMLALTFGRFLSQTLWAAT